MAGLVENKNYSSFFSISYDKFFKEYYPNGDEKAMLYLNIGPTNEDGIYLREFYVYDWVTFFGDMGSYIGLLLGWSFLSIFDMIVDFVEILMKKKFATIRSEAQAKIEEIKRAVSSKTELWSMVS
jgi:hypothetical protein